MFICAVKCSCEVCVVCRSFSCFQPNFMNRYNCRNSFFVCISRSARMWALKKKIHIFLKRTWFNFSSGFIPFRASMCGAFAYSTEILTSFSCCSALFWCYREVSHDFFFCLGNHSIHVLILILVHVPVEIFAVLWTEVSLYQRKCNYACCQ
jgi:hypothetical protein